MRTPESSWGWTVGGGRSHSRNCPEFGRFVHSCCSVTQSCPIFVTSWTVVPQVSLAFTISKTLLKLKSIESVVPSIHLVLCQSLLLSPSIFPSIRVFSNELALRIRWPKYWTFIFGINPSNEYSGFISFRTDWFDILADQGTLKSLLQHHSSKASILWCSAFYMAQLSHPHMTTGKTIALNRWTFVSKVISLLFNILSRFVIAFLWQRKQGASIFKFHGCSHHLQWFCRTRK